MPLGRWSCSWKMVEGSGNVKHISQIINYSWVISSTWELQSPKLSYKRHTNPVAPPPAAPGTASSSSSDMSSMSRIGRTSALQWTLMECDWPNQSKITLYVCLQLISHCECIYVAHMCALVFFFLFYIPFTKYKLFSHTYHLCVASNVCDMLADIRSWIDASPHHWPDCCTDTSFCSY